jgi:hypothetical protein
MRNIFFYSIPRELTEEAMAAAQSFLKWYEKPERWEKEKVKYSRFTIHESKKRNVVIRLA